MDSGFELMKSSLGKFLISFLFATIITINFTNASYVSLGEGGGYCTPPFIQGVNCPSMLFSVIGVPGPYKCTLNLSVRTCYEGSVSYIPDCTLAIYQDGVILKGPYNLSNLSEGDMEIPIPRTLDFNNTGTFDRVFRLSCEGSVPLNFTKSYRMIDLKEFLSWKSELEEASYARRSTGQFFIIALISLFVAILSLVVTVKSLSGKQKIHVDDISDKLFKKIQRKK